MTTNAKDSRLNILNSLCNYQEKIASNRHVILNFGNFGKEVSMILKNLTCLDDETLCFNGICPNTLEYLDVVQNFKMVNFYTSFVEETDFDNDKIFKALEIENLLED